jgi:hypothetical protein
VRGLKESEGRLQVLGYNPTLTKFTIFMLSGFFATVAGILYAYYNQFVSPTTAAFLTSGKGVLMAILGGINTLVGPVIGAFIIVLVENVLSIYVARWPTILGLLFILTIMFARDGLVGAISKGWHTWLARSGREGRARQLEERRAAAQAEAFDTDSDTRPGGGRPPGDAADVKEGAPGPGHARAPGTRRGRK